jgi:succinyl-diaminopimelate desuccinylase
MPIDPDALVRFTQALVRTRSVYEPESGGGEAAAAEVVAAEMRRFGWRPSMEQVAPGRPNVIAVLDGGRPGRTLVFEGHTDVVTEGDPGAWTHDPFGGEIVDGRLYGRGAADMKGGVAAMIHAAAALAAAGPFAGRIVVAALADEEGMMLGVKHFVASGHAAGADGAIVCEPEEREVCVAQKGAIRVRVLATGRMAHGAMPQHGLNPLSALTALAEIARTIESELQQEHGTHPLLGLPYITPTVLLGGVREQINVIPATAWMALDIRTTPAVDHPGLVGRLRTAALAVTAGSGVQLDLTVVDDRPSTETPIDHPLVRALVEAHTLVAGEAPAIGGVPGSTDGTILWRDAGLPIVTYGPGGKWIAHQVDEYVELKDLVRCAEVYEKAATIFLGKDG